MKPLSVRSMAAAALIAAALFMAGPATAGAPAPSFPIDASTLPNGLRLFLHEDHRTPHVAVEIMFPIGRKDDPRDRRGMADLIAQLLSASSTRHLDHRDRYALFRTL